jgi:hypothetical protein
MGFINGMDRNVFREAANTMLGNFDDEEQGRIGKLARELKAILEAAKKREQEKVRKAAP